MPDCTLELANGPALDELRERADELGIDASALIQVVRGFLFVEGMNDKWILNHFFSRELQEAWVEVLALHGGLRAPSLAELELLWSLGKHIAVMLDYVRTQTVEQIRLGAQTSDRLHHEEQWLAALAHAMRNKPARLHLLGIEAPDIVCSIPGEAIRAAICGLGGDKDRFPGWRPLLTFTGSFKRNFAKVTGVDVDSVLRYLRHAGFDGPPSSDLKAAVSNALDFFATSHH
jgi:hypothetical protein